MVGRVLGGVTNLVSGLLGGQQGPQRANQQGNNGWHNGWNNDGRRGQNHTSEPVRQQINDQFVPQKSPDPVNLAPTGPAPANTAQIIANERLPGATPPAPATTKPQTPATQPQAPGQQTAPKAPSVRPSFGQQVFDFFTGREGPKVMDKYVSQYRPKGAEAGYDGSANCAPAVAAMVARNPTVNYGKGMSDAELIADLAKVGGTTGEGTSGNGVIAMYEHMGLDTDAVPGADMAWINSQLKAEKHVTVLGDFYEVPGRTNPAETSGHYLDITGVTRRGNYLVNDPASSQVKYMTADQLKNFISSAPGGGFAISAWKAADAAATAAT